MNGQVQMVQTLEVTIPYSWLTHPLAVGSMKEERIQAFITVYRYLSSTVPDTETQ